MISSDMVYKHCVSKIKFSKMISVPNKREKIVPGHSTEPVHQGHQGAFSMAASSEDSLGT